MPRTVKQVAPDEVPQPDVVALANAVAEADGAPPLSDQTLAGLGSPDVMHFVVDDGQRLVGYAQLGDGSLEVAADVESIAQLLDAASEAADDLRVWSHGGGSRLVPVLERAGFERTRELHQLRRPLQADSLPPDPPLADGVSVRPFEPGRDDDAWLAVNGEAFATHPEQGRQTHADLAARIGASWFDPTGFLLAERAGELLGFHWTKVHADGAGEVYVLGVSPRAQGLGLGSGLLIRGLRHLAARRCPYVLLYVEGDNAGARRLYERAGFLPYDIDVQWRGRSTNLARVGD